MFAHLCCRFEHSLGELIEQFAAITDDHIIAGLNIYAMAHQRALTTPDLHTYHSTASAPSLRSREPMTAMDRPFTPPDAEGSNHVKVVVRVRH